jgi:hypothetical protein
LPILIARKMHKEFSEGGEGEEGGLLAVFLAALSRDTGCLFPSLSPFSLLSLWTDLYREG